MSFAKRPSGTRTIQRKVSSSKVLVQTGKAKNPAAPSRATLSRHAKNGKLIRVEPGIYIKPETDISPEEIQFATACKRFGAHSSIGGLSALFHYGLIEQVPSRVWVMVKPEQRTTLPLYRLVRTKADLAIGIEKHEFYRMTNLERTLLEALRLQAKVGLRVAVGAVRKALAEGKTNESQLGLMADALSLDALLAKYWEMIVA